MRVCRHAYMPELKRQHILSYLSNFTTPYFLKSLNKPSTAFTGEDSLVASVVFEGSEALSVEPGFAPGKF
jgi:hypothetical protein